MAVNRLRGLNPRAAGTLRELSRLLESGDVIGAERMLPITFVLAPDHPETLRLAGLVHHRRGRFDDAVGYLRAASAAAADDVGILAELGRAELDGSNADAAIDVFVRACTLQPTATSWLNLGVALDRRARVAEAMDAADRALALDPDNARTHWLRARCLHALGRISEAVDEYRRLIRFKQEAARAWFALLDIKTIRLEPSEFAELRKFTASPARSATEMVLLEFALGRAFEDAGQYEDAFHCFCRGNAAARRDSPWDRDVHGRASAAIAHAFEKPAATSSPAELGREVVFIVGLPRSGSTLVEQVLAAHPQVEGASELSDMQDVIAQETARQRAPFEEWSKRATPADWERLGREYLARTASWRGKRPIFTDKAPENWTYVGAIAAMLPAARIIDFRRDALETCWSCFKQLFAPSRAGFSYSFDDLAAYWDDYRRLSAHWSTLFPARFPTLSYEELIAAPESQTRILLDFCGLPFHSDCLQPHLAQRSIRTTSSAQVRQPLRNNTARAHAYGDLLDPLRAGLGADRRSG